MFLFLLEALGTPRNTSGFISFRPHIIHYLGTLTGKSSKKLDGGAQQSQAAVAKGAASKPAASKAKAAPVALPAAALPAAAAALPAAAAALPAAAAATISAGQHSTLSDFTYLSMAIQLTSCTHTHAVDFAKMMEMVTKLTAEVTELKAEKKHITEPAGPPARPKPTKYLLGGKGADDFTEVKWPDTRVQICDETRQKIIQEIAEGVGLTDCMCIFVCC